MTLHMLDLLYRRVGLTGFECSTVKKSGLHRNLALGDWSSRERRERPLECATPLSRLYSATETTSSQSLRHQPNRPQQLMSGKHALTARAEFKDS